MIPLNRDFSVKEEYDMDGSGGGGAALDETLVTLLKDLRKAEGKKINVQPWVIFQNLPFRRWRHIILFPWMI